MESMIQAIKMLQQKRVFLRGMIRSLEIDLRGRQDEIGMYKQSLHDVDKELDRIRSQLPEPEEVDYDEPAPKRRRVG